MEYNKSQVNNNAILAAKDAARNVVLSHTSTPLGVPQSPGLDRVDTVSAVNEKNHHQTLPTLDMQNNLSNTNAGGEESVEIRNTATSLAIE